MRPVLIACLAMFVVAAGLRAEEKIDASKLVGTWKLTKSEDPNAPKDAIVEFSSDNKLTITVKVGDENKKFSGTYKVDGANLTVTVKSPDDGKDVEETDTITTLTDEKLVLLDKQKKTTELTRQK
jgi:uncharacterized protein (TIGR03066 family)